VKLGSQQGTCACAQLDAFDTWALRKILTIIYTHHKTNTEIRAVSRCPCLRLFGHIARSVPDEVHHHTVAAAIRKPPSDWKRPPGRPNCTWLRATVSDLRPLNIGPSYVWKKAASREHWHSNVSMAMLKKSMPRSE